MASHNISSSDIQIIDIEAYGGGIEYHSFSAVTYGFNNPTFDYSLANGSYFVHNLVEAGAVSTRPSGFGFIYPRGTG